MTSLPRHRLGLSSFALLTFPANALAATGDDPATAGLVASVASIDWGPLLTALVAILVGAVALVGRYALRATERYLETRTGIELDDCARRYLEATFENALAYGAVRTAELAERGRLKSDVRSVVLAEAAQYVIDSVPDALARFRLDRAGIERRLAARLGLPPAPAEGGGISGHPSTPPATDASAG